MGVDGSCTKQKNCNTYPLNLYLMLLPKLQSLRLHPQRVPRVVCQAARDGGLVVKDDERRRGLPADLLEHLRF